MNISEKIKFLRKRVHITQNDLAKESGIHPVSIRKYETNKMKPQAEQIERIANALSVSPFALLDNNYQNITTVGDFYGILIRLYKLNIITFNQSISCIENINLEISDNILKLFNLNSHINGITEKANYNTFSISINEKLKQLPSYSAFVKLVEYYNKKQHNDNTELLELELQQSPELLSDL